MNKAKYLNDVLTNYEAEEIILRLPKLSLEEYGSEKMLKKHINLERLNMQSIKNALLGGEDFILETFVTHEKVKDLINELYLSWAFRRYIYPNIAREILEINSVKSYIVIYHEAVIVNLLENFFFHATACSNADDYIVDIIEYCYDFASRLVNNQINVNSGEKKVEIKNNNNKSSIDSELADMDLKIKDLEQIIGFSAISIIRYISDHLNQLPFPVRHHMMDVKDIPMILVALMEYKPWIRRIDKKMIDISSTLRDEKEGYYEEIYENNKWTKLSSLGNKLPKMEAQIWICLFNLFMNQENTKKYEITEFRKSNLLRLRKYMNDNLFDQIPPLQNMYRALEEMSLMACNTSSSNNPFIVEMVPELYKNFTQSKKEDFYKQLSLKILNENFKKSDKKKDLDMISEIYNFENIEYFMDDPKCANCGKDASNRCSRCKSEWYCGKDCQKICWKKHKEFCQKLADLNKENEAYDKARKAEKEKEQNFNLNKILKEEGLEIKDGKLDIKNVNDDIEKLSLKNNRQIKATAIPEPNKSSTEIISSTKAEYAIKNQFDELD